MISSAAYSSHPFFRFKTEDNNHYASVPFSQTKTLSSIEKKVYFYSFKSHPQQLECRWVKTEKSYPKMEMQWTVVESE